MSLGPQMSAESDLPAFSFQIDLVEVTDYIVVWEEDLTQGLAQVAVGIPTLQIAGLSSNFEKPFTLEATTTLGEAGILELNGEVISAGDEFDLELKLQNFLLNTATAYVNEFANVTG